MNSKGPGCARFDRGDLDRAKPIHRGLWSEPAQRLASPSNSIHPQGFRDIETTINPQPTVLSFSSFVDDIMPNADAKFLAYHFGDEMLEFLPRERHLALAFAKGVVATEGVGDGEFPFGLTHNAAFDEFDVGGRLVGINDLASNNPALSLCAFKERFVGGKDGLGPLDDLLKHHGLSEVRDQWPDVH